MRSVERKYSTNWLRKLLVTSKRIKFWQRRKNSLRTGKGSYGFGNDCRCASFVPPISFDRYYSFNSDIDERVSFKPGIVSRDDVLLIAHELGPSWKTVGRVLNVPDLVIDDIDRYHHIEDIEEDEFEVRDKCLSKCNCLVLGWVRLTECWTSRMLWLIRLKQTSLKSLINAIVSVIV